MTADGIGRTGRRRRHWADLPSAGRVALVATAVVQIGLAVAAWRDLARRPAAAVRGPKPLWAAVICVNFVGPLAYLKWGRRRTADSQVEFDAG